MAGNKRIRRTSDRTAKSLAKETPVLSPSELKKQVHRLEVAIAAAPRELEEHRRKWSHTLPPPDSMRRGKPVASAARLTHAQALKRRQQLWLGFAQFLVSAVLLAGAAAWLFKLWQKSH
jgi:hypothetical protein